MWVGLAPMDIFIKTIMAAFKLKNSHKSHFKHRIKFPQHSYKTFNDKNWVVGMCPDITMVQILNWLGREVFVGGRVNQYPEENHEG